MPADSVEEFRANFLTWAESFPDPDGVRFESWSDGDGLWVVPDGIEGDRAILHLHGGAYLLGGSATHRVIGGELAKAARTPVLLLNYPLAPETPFPAALEAALDALAQLAQATGSAQRVGVSGDSAGAGLALATLIASRDQGIALPAAYVGISPWVDLTQSGASHQDRQGRDPFIRTEVLADCAAAYLAGNDPRDQLASPLFADLSGLPPFLIQVGTEELLFDDATRLEARARECGVEARLSITEGAPHVWHQFASFLPEARESIQEYGRFMSARLTREAGVSSSGR